MSKKYSLRELEIMAGEIADEIIKDSNLSRVFMSALNRVAEIRGMDAEQVPKVTIEDPDTLEIMAENLGKEAFDLHIPRIHLPKGVNWRGVAVEATTEGIDASLKIKTRRDAKNQDQDASLAHIPELPPSRISDQSKLLDDFSTQMEMKSKLAFDTDGEEKLAFRPRPRPYGDREEDRGKSILRGTLVGAGLGIGAGVLLSKGKGLMQLNRSNEIALKETKSLRDFGSVLADKYKSIHLDDAEYVAGLFKGVDDPAVRTSYHRVFDDVKNTARELKNKITRSPGTEMDPSLYDEIVGHYNKHIEPSGMPQPAKDELKKYIDDTFQVRRRGPGPGAGDSGPPRGSGGPGGQGGQGGHNGPVGEGPRQPRSGNSPRRSSQFAERLNATLHDPNPSSFPGDMGALLPQSDSGFRRMYGVPSSDYTSDMLKDYQKHYGKIKLDE